MQDSSKERVDFTGHLAPGRPEESLTPDPHGGTAIPPDGIHTIIIRLAEISETESEYNRG